MSVQNGRAVERLRTMAAFIALEPRWQSPSRGAILGPDYARVMSEAAAEIAALRDIIAAVRPYVGAITCYASTVDEHEGNRIALLVEEAFNGRD